MAVSLVSKRDGDSFEICLENRTKRGGRIRTLAEVVPSSQFAERAQIYFENYIHAVNNHGSTVTSTEGA